MHGDDSSDRPTRRRFIAATMLGLASSHLRAQPKRVEPPAHPVIDIHQHTSFRAREDADLLDHQERLGVAKTILLPAGRMNGLAARASGNLHTFRLVQQHPRRFATFANDVVYLPGAGREIEFFLKKGAIGIGELKDNVDCDSSHMQRVAELAREYRVPMLIHFQEGTYNSGFPRFGRMVERYPDVTFIGHASTWWYNIDGGFRPESDRRPTGRPVPGGLTDRWLKDYPNLYGDLSASGAQALLRDAEFSRDFITRHQDKLLFATDCFCRAGIFPTGGCRGDALLLAFSQSLPDSVIRRKLMFANAQKLFKFPEFQSVPL
jgi:predicted TIM-barrel fold metal-dependent hydrolase